MGVAGIEAGRKPLPTDPDKREEALALNEIPAGMIVGAVNTIATAAKVTPLNATEQKEGRMAFSALLYEYGANLSAASLVVMWLVIVVTPRVVEYFQKKQAEEAAKRPNLSTAMLQAQAAAAHADTGPKAP